jgi:hypothetical protein
MDAKTRIPKLKGSSNWDLFKIRIRAILAEKGYISAIKPEKAFPKSTAKEILEEEKEKRAEIAIKASAIIRLNLDDGPLIQTKNIEEDNAEKLFNRLEALYEPKGFSSEFLIAKELFSTTLSRCGNSIEAYLTKIRQYTDDLAARDKAIPIEIIAAYTLNNLTREYDYIIAAINQTFRNEEEIDLDDLFSQILDESRRIEAREPQETALYSHYKAKNKPNGFKREPKKPIKCYRCEKIGHIARNCDKEEKEDSATLTL